MAYADDVADTEGAMKIQVSLLQYLAALKTLLDNLEARIAALE